MSEKSTEVDDDELTLNIIDQNVPFEKNSTTILPKGETTTKIDVNSVQVTEKIKTSREDIEIESGQNESANELFDSTLKPDEKVSEKSTEVDDDELTNVVEKIKNYPETINLPQDENEVIEANVIKIVCSICFFMVLTISIGLLIFCLRGKEKKPDVMEMMEKNGSDTASVSIQIY